MENILHKLETLKSRVEELAKWGRQGSMTAVNREAHYQALTAVKDHVLKYVANLVSDMKQDEVKHVAIAGCELTVRKIMSDMYSGAVRRGTSNVHEFDRITIPQLAGQLQSLLELYDPENLDDQSQPPQTLLVETLKPFAEQAENGMVSQLIALLSGQKTVAAAPVDSKAEILEIIAEANAITEEAKRSIQSVDPKTEVQELKERVEAMLHRVESIVTAQAPTSQGNDKFHDTLHQIQQKHDMLTDRVQQELNILNDKIKTATDSLDSKKSGKTITITVD